jgi:hypothetical protein
MVSSRCQSLLGFSPSVERLMPSSEVTVNPFNYGIAKLKSTGFTLQSQYHNEIDSTLSLCQMEFLKY